MRAAQERFESALRAHYQQECARWIGSQEELEERVRRVMYEELPSGIWDRDRDAVEVFNPRKRDEVRW